MQIKYLIKFLLSVQLWQNVLCEMVILLGWKHDDSWIKKIQRSNWKQLTRIMLRRFLRNFQKEKDLFLIIPVETWSAGDEAGTTLDWLQPPMVKFLVKWWFPNDALKKVAQNSPRYKSLLLVCLLSFHCLICLRALSPCIVLCVWLKVCP